jgi:hypothetical protein
MANIGAFVAADKDIIDYLKYNLRSQMFKSIAYDSNCRFIETIRVVATRIEKKTSFGKMLMHYKAV